MAITHVQGISADGSGATPLATLGATPTNGNLLVAFVTANLDPSMTAANGFTKLTHVHNTDGAALFYKVASGEITAIAPCTLGTGVAWGCAVEEWTGTHATAPLDVENAQLDDDATKTSPTVDPANGVERLLIGAAMAITSSSTFSGQTVNGSTAGVTEGADRNAGGPRCCLWTAVIADTSTNTFVTEATASAAEAGSCHIAMFAPTTGTPPPAGQQRLMLLGVG